MLIGLAMRKVTNNNRQSYDECDKSYEKSAHQSTRNTLPRNHLFPIKKCCWFDYSNYSNYSNYSDYSDTSTLII